jgi:hypothetical protein
LGQAATDKVLKDRTPPAHPHGVIPLNRGYAKQAIRVDDENGTDILFVEQIQKQKKGCSKAVLFDRAVLLAVEHVHRDFKAKAHFGVYGFGPHGKAPLIKS